MSSCFQIAIFQNNNICFFGCFDRFTPTHEQCVPDLRSSIDEALLRAITVNPIQNEPTPSSCSYLDLTLKPDSQTPGSVNVSSKANAGGTLHSMADIVSIDANAHAATTISTSSTSSSIASSSQYNAPNVCMVTHLSSSINQDLAEADQSMENDVTNIENAANSPEILNESEHGNDLIPDCENSNEGAVGGLEASPLPDLAKVTTSTANCEVDYTDADL